MNSETSESNNRVLEWLQQSVLLRPVYENYTYLHKRSQQPWRSCTGPCFKGYQVNHTQAIVAAYHFWLDLASTNYFRQKSVTIIIRTNVDQHTLMISTGCEDVSLLVDSMAWGINFTHVDEIDEGITNTIYHVI